MKLTKLNYRLRIYFLVNLVKRNLRKYGLIKKVDTVSDTFYGACAVGNIPIHELWYHADSNNDEVLVAIASVPNCPSDLVQHILRKANSYVKYKIVENKSDCDSDFLRLVYNQSLSPNDYAVRTLIMVHPSCPMDIRKEIMEDPDCQPFVGEIPNLQEYYIRKYFNTSYHIKETMCSIQRLPKDMVDDVLRSNDEVLINRIHHNSKLKK